MLFALCVMMGLRSKATAQVVEVTTTDTIVCCGETILHTSLLNPIWTEMISGTDYPGSSITIPISQMGTLSAPAQWAVQSGSILIFFYVVYSPPPTPHLPTDTTVCTSGVLNPGSYASYLWSTGATTQTLTVTATGNYSVTVNDGYCSGSTVSHVNVEKDSVVLCNVSTRPQGGAIVTWLVLSGINPLWNVVVQRSAGLNIWGTVAIAPYGDSTATDLNAITDLNAYKYRVFVQSPTCGNSVPSLSQGTILLSNTGTNWTWKNPDGLNNLQYIVWEHTTTGSNIPVDTLLSCTGTSCANTSPMVTIPGYNVDYGYVMYSNICSYGKSLLFHSRSNNSSCLITGIGVDSKQTISLYPNPTTDHITISGIEGKFTTAVYDYSGRLILQGENQKNIDLSRFHSGIYMIKIVSEKGVFTRKVVRE